MNLIQKYFYVMASLLITGYLVFISQAIFEPILIALLMALAIKPLVLALEYIKIPRLISTLLAVCLFVLFILSLIFIFSIQVGSINFETASIQKNFDGWSYTIEQFVWRILGVSPDQQASILAESYTGFLNAGTSLIRNALSFTTSFLTSFVLFILALFFFLYYQDFFAEFLYKITKPNHHKKLQIILSKIQTVVYHYIIGLFLVVFVVAVLNSIGLLLLGVENAVFFGVLAAVLTLIPYIGITLGSLLPMTYVFLTQGSLWYAFAVLLVFLAVQAIEGNLLTPNIVGRQVRINPFAAILGLVLAGMFLGIAGVILALPLLAIFKVIFDEVPALNSLGYLLGISEKHFTH